MSMSLHSARPRKERRGCRTACACLLSGYCPVESHSRQQTAVEGGHVSPGQPLNTVGSHHQPFTGPLPGLQASPSASPL